jgi:hypothetical protein
MTAMNENEGPNGMANMAIGDDLPPLQNRSLLALPLDRFQGGKVKPEGQSPVWHVQPALLPAAHAQGY